MIDLRHRNAGVSDHRLNGLKTSAVQVLSDPVNSARVSFARLRTTGSVGVDGDVAWPRWTDSNSSSIFAFRRLPAAADRHLVLGFQIDAGAPESVHQPKFDLICYPSRRRRGGCHPSGTTSIHTRRSPAGKRSECHHLSKTRIRCPSRSCRRRRPRGRGRLVDDPAAR